MFNIFGVMLYCISLFYPFFCTFDSGKKNLQDRRIMSISRLAYVLQLPVSQTSVHCVAGQIIYFVTSK